MLVRRAAVPGGLLLLVAAGPVAAPLSSPSLPPRAASRLAAPLEVPLSSGLRSSSTPAPPSRAVAPQPPEPVRRTASGVAGRAGRTAPTYAERRGAAALAALDWPWQELAFEVRFRPYRGRFLGLTDASTRTITVYVKRGQSEGDLRTTVAHELGHALDAVTGTEEMRAAYRELRGIDADVPWYPCDRCEDLRSPAGDFAETFARWLVGPGHVRATRWPAPDAEQLERLGYLFAPLSERQG